MSRAPGYPHGWSREQIERLRGYIRRDWGLGSTIAAAFGQTELSPADREWAANAEQQGASPGAALELLDMNLEADVRDVLKRVTAPVHVVHSASDTVMPVGASRFLAAELPDAEYEELEGSQHAFFHAEPGFWAERVRRVLARKR
jgi:pimeloyl-ACP methyl ester carboxylesterase